VHQAVIIARHTQCISSNRQPNGALVEQAVDECLQQHAGLLTRTVQLFTLVPAAQGGQLFPGLPGKHPTVRLQSGIRQVMARIT